MAVTGEIELWKKGPTSQLQESSRFLQKLSTFLGVWATQPEGLDPTLEN